jgi:hypothetical protein
VATRGLLVVIFAYGAKSFFVDFREEDVRNRLIASTYEEYNCEIAKLNVFGLKTLYCDPPVKTFLGD